MKIPLPQRGQPIDIDYIYQIVSQLNSLSSIVGSNTTVLSTVNNGVSPRKENTTNNLRFFADTKNVRKATVAANFTEQFYFDLNPSFIQVPIVTISVVNNNKSAAGNSVTAVITNVSTSRVDGIVFYQNASSTGAVDININMIAVGVTSVVNLQ